MPRHEQLDDEELEMRSLLMRLYHSRQMGEDFYPAAFVNGHAPQMERDGWIERCGQGWRLTESGVKVWAHMNPELIAYKYQYGQQLFNEMRVILRGEEEMAGKVCVVEGCGKPRFVTAKGEEHTRCEQHQRGKWRDDAEIKRQKKATAEPSPQPSPASEEGREKLDRLAIEIAMSEKRREERLKVIEPLPMDEPEVDMSAFAGSFDAVMASIQSAPVHNCETCEAKRVLDALRGKSPKLAALIDAMEAQEQAAKELGL